jgi:hypothetical protein
LELFDQFKALHDIEIKRLKGTKTLASMGVWNNTKGVEPRLHDVKHHKDVCLWKS